MAPTPSRRRGSRRIATGHECPARRVALKYVVSSIVAACALSVWSCAEDDSAAATDGATNTSTCEPGTSRECPCLGEGHGAQGCNGTGDGYGPCTGCPAPDASQDSSATADAGPPELDATVDPEGAGAASVPQDDGDASTDPLQPGGESAVVEGTLCGVGLPMQCALGDEKCCVRSLSADSCIAVAETCDCNEGGCTTLEATCDGPEDCPDGQVCCGSFSSASRGARYTLIECAAQCDSRGSQRVMCHEGETECEGGFVCANSQLLSNSQVCIDPMSIEQ